MKPTRSHRNKPPTSQPNHPADGFRSSPPAPAKLGASLRILSLFFFSFLFFCISFPVRSLRVRVCASAITLFFGAACIAVRTAKEPTCRRSVPLFGVGRPSTHANTHTTCHHLILELRLRATMLRGVGSFTAPILLHRRLPTLSSPPTILHRSSSLLDFYLLPTTTANTSLLLLLPPLLLLVLHHHRHQMGDVLLQNGLKLQRTRSRRCCSSWFLPCCSTSSSATSSRRKGCFLLLLAHHNCYGAVLPILVFFYEPSYHHHQQHHRDGLYYPSGSSCCDHLGPLLGMIRLCASLGELRRRASHHRFVCS